jgi:hypothetical protein
MAKTNREITYINSFKKRENYINKTKNINIYSRNETNSNINWNDIRIFGETGSTAAAAAVIAAIVTVTAAIAHVPRVHSMRRILAKFAPRFAFFPAAALVVSALRGIRIRFGVVVVAVGSGRLVKTRAHVAARGHGIVVGRRGTGRSRAMQV